MELNEGDRGQALLLFERVMRQYPESALASRALDRCLSSILAEESLQTQLNFLSRQRPSEKGDLGEKLDYTKAKLLYQNDQLEAAKGAFLRLASEYPYPTGGYWDDALWYAADIERRSQAPEAALALLHRMLSEREPAHFQGSYQRPRYAEAQFRIAEIYRDDLKDPIRAQSAFRRVFSDHPTSLLRDDALWQEARLAHQLRRHRAACNAVEALIENLPDSRFVGCSKHLCPDAEVPSSSRCRPYILKQLQTASDPGQSSK
jgi:tetratricopeptide (TPR) repeat protein